LDIDHFKTVNDTYGHQAGDRVLQELTGLIAQHIRKVDYLARYGGEEFVILAPDTDLDGMYQLAEKLRRITETHVFHGQTRISLSVGVAQFASEDTIATLIGRADAALYRAKTQGRNRVERS
jgi:diguanylate cyclase (GGDEF)-like protein